MNGSWRETGDSEPLREAALAGSVHWHDAARRLLREHGGDPVAAERTIATWIAEPGALVL